MKNKRREFLKQTALTTLGVAGSGFVNAFASDLNNFIPSTSNMNNKKFDEQHLSVIGLYGRWAASLNENKLPSLSFRRKEFINVDEWRKSAKRRTMERMGIANIGGMPNVNVNKEYTYDGLHIE